MKEGFSFIYSPNSPEMRELEEIFKLLDKDGSGTLSFEEVLAHCWARGALGILCLFDIASGSLRRYACCPTSPDASLNMTITHDFF